MWLYAAVIAGIAIALIELKSPADPADESEDLPPDDNTDQLTTTLEDFQVTISPSTYTPAAVPQGTAAQNEAAFLDMLAWSEGVSDGLDGYRTLFGSRRNAPLLFDSFADHPRIAKSFTDKAGRTLWTSAAGRYQFMAVSPIPGGGSTRVNTWDTLQRRLQLPDFGPASQDTAALELVRERGALLDVRAGRIQSAITKCAPIWASLPGAGYAQAERKLTTLLAQFAQAGGNLEA